MIFFRKKINIILISCYYIFNDKLIHNFHSNDFNLYNCFFSRLNSYSGSDIKGGVIYCYNYIKENKLG